MDLLKLEIAAHAARLVVEEGLEYGPAKRRAARQLGRLPSARDLLPSNEELEQAVREHLALFHADSQPRELAALRRLALRWMERMAPFRPYLSGSVWHGTATRRSDIFIQLFCDDPKSAEIGLLDQRVRFEARATTGLHGASVDALSFSARCDEIDETVGIHLLVYDHDDLRGALKPDAGGRAPRGDATALRRLLVAGESP